MDLMFNSASPETRNWPHKVISEVFTDVTEQVNYFAEIFCSFVGVTLGGMTAFIVCFVNNTLTSTKI